MPASAFNNNRLNWNVSTNAATDGASLTGMTRHNSTTAAAADGHAEILHLPPQKIGNPVPANMLELGDVHPGGGLWPNSGKEKMWVRELNTTAGF